jgi:hypothetical protein
MTPLFEKDIVNPDRSGDVTVELIGLFPPEANQAAPGLGWGPKDDLYFSPVIISDQRFRSFVITRAYSENLYPEPALGSDRPALHVSLQGIFGIGFQGHILTDMVKIDILLAIEGNL